MKQTIIAAIITGLFTIAAGVGTYWFTQKEPALTYSVVGSPILPGTGDAKQIYVIEVRNTGRREVSNALAEVGLRSAKIEESASESSPGLKLKEEKRDSSFSVNADTINPGEYMKLSLLLSSKSGEFSPSVIVRAPGVNASLLDPGKKSESVEKLPILLSALAATFSVLIGASPIVRRILGFSPMSIRMAAASLDQNEVSSYICARAGLDEESRLFRFSLSDCSYRGAADFLMFQGLKSEESVRPKYIAALKAFLLNERMSDVSIASIKRAIRILSSEPFEEASLTKLTSSAIGEGDDPAELRNRIDSFLAAELHNGK